VPVGEPEQERFPLADRNRGDARNKTLRPASASLPLTERVAQVVKIVEHGRPRIVDPLECSVAQNAKNLICFCSTKPAVLIKDADVRADRMKSATDFHRIAAKLDYPVVHLVA
jgi:hypothetical protein